MAPRGSQLSSLPALLVFAAGCLNANPYYEEPEEPEESASASASAGTTTTAGEATSEPSSSAGTTTTSAGSDSGPASEAGSESDATTVSDTGSPGLCGDGVIDPGEECDDGRNNADKDAYCTLDCKENVCGDGLLGPDEACDDGNTVSWDGCSDDCSALCGNGVLEDDEECDEGDANHDTLGPCTTACAPLPDLLLDPVGTSDFFGVPGVAKKGSCAMGHVVGLFGAHDMGALAQLGMDCVGLTPYTPLGGGVYRFTWGGAPAGLLDFGYAPLMPQEFEAKCDPDYPFLVEVDGWVGAGAIHGLTLTCADYRYYPGDSGYELEVTTVEKKVGPQRGMQADISADCTAKGPSAFATNVYAVENDVIAGIQLECVTPLLNDW
jgi:cysteine-rich repeat protein